MEERFRIALRIIDELRAKDRVRTSRRSVGDVLRIAEISRILFKRYFEVVDWEGENRVLRMKI
ncbi:hypothetical protein [Staphylothermus marinus]|uniref:hypothetical protein n=1 Tax=Staphylothermus marinus TaxID=2280 RepID=UPI00069A9F74|nr:hypothetical protein [Staphylothermus marinus]